MTARRGRTQAQIRQDEALALWISGHTYDKVAEELNYANRGAAHKAVQAALQRHNTDASKMAEQGRAIALERLRPLWRKALANACGAEGTAKDIMAAAHIADRLARLEGVKDPEQEVRLTVESEIDADIARIEKALALNGVDLAAVVRGATG